jgi:hypothetical protein
LIQKCNLPRLGTALSEVLDIEGEVEATVSHSWFSTDSQ